MEKKLAAIKHAEVSELQYDVSNSNDVSSPITITGTTAGQSESLFTPVQPFQNVVINDTSLSATTETVTISGFHGILADPNYSTDNGRINTATGAYTFTDTTANITKDIEALKYAQNGGIFNNETNTLQISVSDNAGNSATDSTTTVTGHFGLLGIGIDLVGSLYGSSHTSGEYFYWQ